MKKLLLCLFFGAMGGTAFYLNSDQFDLLAQAFDAVKDHIVIREKRSELLSIKSHPMETVLRGADKKDILDVYVNQVNDLASYNDLIVQSKSSDMIRVMTYNIHYWADPQEKYSNIDDVFDVVKNIDADVVCLQEVSLGKTNFNNKYAESDIIKKMNELGYRYGDASTFISVGNFFGAPFGNMIFSKYTLRDVVTKLYKDGTRGFVGVTLEFNGKPLRIYCTHFDVWDASGKMREAEAKEFVEYVQKNDKNVKDVLLVGDFNEARKQDYTKDIWEKYVQFMQDKFKMIQRYAVSQVLHNAGFKDAYELTNYRPPFTCWTGSIIDFGYLQQSGDWYVKDVNAYFTDWSDHLPIVFDLAIK